MPTIGRQFLSLCPFLIAGADQWLVNEATMIAGVFHIFGEWGMGAAEKLLFKDKTPAIFSFRTRRSP